MDKSYQKVVNTTTDLIAEGFRNLSDGYQPLKDTPKFLDEFLAIPAAVKGFSDNLPKEAVSTSIEEDNLFWNGQINKVTIAIREGQPEKSEDDAGFLALSLVLPLRQVYSVYSSAMRAKKTA